MKFSLADKLNWLYIDINSYFATQERVGDNGDIEYIENVEFVFENKWKAEKEKNNSSNRETDYLAEIKEESIEKEGIGIDKSWFSKLSAIEEKENKKVLLDSSSELIKDRVKSNYLIKLTSTRRKGKI